MCRLSSIACVVLLLAGAGAASATQINVALLSATAVPAYDTDIVAKIQANASFLNITVLRVDTATPTLGILDDYKAVMVIGDNAFADASGLGTNLRQYIDQGNHGVVVTAMTNQNGYQLGGTFGAGDYWAIEPGTFKSQAAILGTVYLPLSPLLTSVGTGASGFDGGTKSYRINGAVNGAATRVADWSDGIPFLATRAFGTSTEVAMNFYPPSADAGTGFWLTSTKGGLIMANAFTVAAGGTGSSEGDVPEPGTYLLTATGFGLLALVLKRRQRTLQCESAPRPRHR